MKRFIRALLAGALCPLLAAQLTAAPQANPDPYDATEDVELFIPAPGVLGNDVPDPGAFMNAILTTGPTHGAVALNPDGSFFYTPAANYNGPDSFQYKVIGTRNFVIDRSRSIFNVKVRATISLGTDEDQDNAAVIGNAQVFLDPTAPPLQQIRIQDLTVTLDEAVDIHLSWLFGLATLNGHINQGGLTIEMDQAGPAAAIGAGGTFSQFGNTFDSTGTIFLTASGLAGIADIPPTADLNIQDEPYDITPIATEPALGNPQITQVGGNFELRVPIKIEQTFTDPNYTATVTVKGTIYAIAPINPLPESGPTTVSLNVLPVDDPPTPGADRYYTRRNVLISIPATATLTTEDLITAGSNWKYAAGPNDLGTAWREWGYNDSAWPSGPAQLGYGDNDEGTPIDDGPDANRYPTYYFRRGFTLNSPFDTVQPQFEILRDDAAAIYVNGVEIYRDSEPYAAGGPEPLPAAPAQISYATLSTAIIPDETAFRATATGGAPLSFSRRLLYEGRNVVAVEVHQFGANGVVNSSDVSFDFKLRRQRGVAGLLSNDTDIEGDILTAALLQAPAHGSAVVQQNGAFSYSPAPGFHGVDTFRYQVLQNGAPAGIDTVVVPLGSTWQYLDNGTNQGVAWKDLAFVPDASWKLGAAELGYGDGGESTQVEDDPEPGYTQPANNPRFITTYFRQTFNVTDRATIDSLRLRYVRDDGLAIYVNGHRVWLDNLDADVPYNQPARGSISGADESAILQSDIIPATMLVEGVNVIAAEIHQSDTGSSDISFNLELSLHRATTAVVTLEVLDDDVDNDLMSDTWERANGIDFTVANGGADPDADGESNRDEFTAGTDPRSTGSVFRVRQISASLGGYLLTLESTPGKQYQLQLSPDLATWSNSGSPFFAAPTGNTTPVLVLAPGPRHFFRWQVLNTWQ
ncbi:MAG TPA: Ig-like domain-containing protein [Chthoniobacteraceae bacterium]|nr:Ig-like domain-containing protein [Chthoniobacteraceae bacterium]